VKEVKDYDVRFISPFPLLLLSLIVVIIDDGIVCHNNLSNPPPRLPQNQEKQE